MNMRTFCSGVQTFKKCIIEQCDADWNAIMKQVPAGEKKVLKDLCGEGENVEEQEEVVRCFQTLSKARLLLGLQRSHYHLASSSRFCCDTTSSTYPCHCLEGIDRGSVTLSATTRLSEDNLDERSPGCIAYTALFA